MLHMSVELISFYNIFKDETSSEIHVLGEDLKKANENFANIEVLNTGSGFENLYLPHIEGRSLNVDADHMIIRHDIAVCDRINKVLAQTDDSSSENRTDIVFTEKNNDLQPEVPIKDHESFNSLSKKDIFHVYKGCHEGYIFLCKKQYNGSMQFDKRFIKENCLSNVRFVTESQSLVKLFANVIMSGASHITGPSLAKKSNGRQFAADRDFVFALRCRSWPHQANEWLTRQRRNKWPSEKQVKEIESLGCLIVPVASHLNKLVRDYEWRLSFSKAELKLVETFTENIKLGYAILKALIKYAMKQKNLTMFASYHLKTSLLWFTEKFGLEKVKHWNIEKIMRDLLELLVEFYRNNSLPNYFVRDNNMIDHRKHEEIKECEYVLINISKNFLSSVIHFIDTCHKLPVEFEKPFRDILSCKNSCKIFQFFKYNFLLMELYHELMVIVDPSYTHINKQLISKAKHLHEASNEEDIEDIESLKEITDEFSVDQILALLKEYLEVDQLLVTEKSGVAMAVFNMILVCHPKFDAKNTKSSAKMNFYDYKSKCSIFIDVLNWVSEIHQRHADIIYQFVEKNLKYGPKFVSSDKKLNVFGKLMMVVLGKPTKQSKSVTGSVLKVDTSEQIFLTFRFFATFLLCYDLELSYIVYQSVAWMINRTPLDEIWCTVKYSVWDYLKTRAARLIMSHDELENSLTEYKRDYLQSLII